MSTLNVSNITDGTTTVGTSYVVNGSAKAFGMYQMSGTATLYESLNISSLTDSGLGYATLTLSNAMATAGCSITAANGVGSGQYLCSNVGQSSASAYIHLTQDPATNTWYDTSMHSSVHGDLA
jgi:hypothetical protein